MCISCLLHVSPESISLSAPLIALPACGDRRGPLSVSAGPSGASAPSSGLGGRSPGASSVKDGQRHSFSFSFPNAILLKQKILEE